MPHRRLHHRAAVAAHILPRGVWELPYLSPDGSRVVASIDSQGRIVQQCRITPTSDVRQIYQTLQSELDRADPIPTLRAI